MGDLLSTCRFRRRRSSGQSAVAANSERGLATLQERSSDAARQVSCDHVRSARAPRVSFELYQLRNRSRGFDEAWRAIIGCELEKALRFFLVLLNQRKLAAVKISFAGLRLLGPRVGVEGRAKGLFGSELAEEVTDHGRRPCGHVELLHGFCQMARRVVAPFGEIAPDRGIGVLRVEFGGLLEIGDCVRDTAANDII